MYTQPTNGEVPHLKNILLACGAGLVTSTVAKNKLVKELDKRGYEGKYTVTQCKIAEVDEKSGEYDFCVSTAKPTSETRCPILEGMPFLTGKGIEELMAKVIAEMEK